MGAIGVKTGIDGTGILMFTARKGYPWQAVQRLIDGTSTTPVYNIPEYLETTVYQYPSYYSKYLETTVYQYPSYYSKYLETPGNHGVSVPFILQ